MKRETKIFWIVSILFLLLIKIIFSQNSGFDYAGTSTIITTTSDTNYLVIADFYNDINNVGTDETDFYSNVINANTLYLNGQKIIARFAGTRNNNTTNSRLKVYFAENIIADTQNFNSNIGGWDCQILLIRSNTDSIKCITTFIEPTNSIGGFSFQNDFGGISFNSGNILKITGQSTGGGAGSNDITAKLGYIAFLSKSKI